MDDHQGIQGIQGILSAPTIRLSNVDKWSVSKTCILVVLAVVESRVFLNRRRSRIDLKQDLDTEEICSDMVSEESIMSPRLRAESDGVIVALEGMRRAASLTLESCLGRPISKNSVVRLIEYEKFD